MRARILRLVRLRRLTMTHRVLLIRFVVLSSIRWLLVIRVVLFRVLIFLLLSFLCFLSGRLRWKRKLLRNGLTLLRRFRRISRLSRLLSFRAWFTLRVLRFGVIVVLVILRLRFTSMVVLRVGSGWLRNPTLTPKDPHTISA